MIVYISTCSCAYIYIGQLCRAGDGYEGERKVEERGSDGREGGRAGWGGGVGVGGGGGGGEKKGERLILALFHFSHSKAPLKDDLIF